MNDFILQVTKNQIFCITSILTLVGFTYLAKRYLKNVENTSNQYYIKPNEQIKTINLSLLDNSNTDDINRKKIYVFWNGDDPSTYLLIDLLIQNYIIQPVYIERYTIIKKLEGKKLEQLARQYKNKPQTSQYKYLQDIAKIKQKQYNELIQLDYKRKIIMNKHTEFNSNFLPTLYITTITKDLDFTTNFFLILKEYKPKYFNGIEFLEQVLRFLKYFPHINNSRIILGYCKDSNIMELVREILKKLRESNLSILGELKKIKIDIPLEDVSMNEIKYLFTFSTPN